MIWWHDDMMQCKRWHDECTNKTNHTTKLGVAGSLLNRRSRGVTTLHHYKRISSRDLGWHRRKTEGEEVKQSCFFDKRVKPWTLRDWTNEKREYKGDERDWKHSVRKEEQWTLLEPCRLKDIRKGLQRTKSTCKHSGWNKMYKEW